MNQRFDLELLLGIYLITVNGNSLIFLSLILINQIFTHFYMNARLIPV